MDKRPIGVFDSGLGGLTAVKELRKILPHEDIVYFGDTARVPYGTRSRKIIQQYLKENIDFLLSKNVKIIIIACGTASTVLIPAMTESFSFAHTGVVFPSAKAAVKQTITGHIGVLATAASIRSGAYDAAIHSISPTCTVYGKACPMFVPLVENGYVDKNNKITKQIAREYLSEFEGTEIDTVILGCTHYPIIKHIIGNLVGKETILIDSGQEAAREAKRILEEQKLLGSRTAKGSYDFYVSDAADSFWESAKMYLGEETIHYATQIPLMTSTTER